MNPWMAIIGAALGGLRASNEQRQMNRQRDTEITKEMWSPWTGQHGKDVGNADTMGRVMQGGTAGMMMGQSMGGGEQAAPQQPNAYSNVPQMGSRVMQPPQMAPQMQFAPQMGQQANYYV